MNIEKSEQRVFAADLIDYFRVTMRTAERKFSKIKEYNGIVKHGIVRWKHVYAWEEAVNEGRCN